MVLALTPWVADEVSCVVCLCGSAQDWRLVLREVRFRDREWRVAAEMRVELVVGSWGEGTGKRCIRCRGKICLAWRGARLAS